MCIICGVVSPDVLTFDGTSSLPWLLIFARRTAQPARVIIVPLFNGWAAMRCYSLQAISLLGPKSCKTFCEWLGCKVGGTILLCSGIKLSSVKCRLKSSSSKKYGGRSVGMGIGSSPWRAVVTWISLVCLGLLDILKVFTCFADIIYVFIIS